jgi:hypothetical protein
MSQKTSEARDLFIIGTGFWKTSKILSNHLGKTHDFDVVSPIFVNMAFAGEVYLKCLHLIRTGKLLKGHDLKSLFDGLPKTDQVSIEDAYNRNVKNSPIVNAMKAQFPEIDLKLSTVVAEAAKTFVQCRYAYEGPANAPKTLGDFVDALQQHLLCVDPTLETALHVPLTKKSSGCGNPPR